MTQHSEKELPEIPDDTRADVRMTSQMDLDTSKSILSKDKLQKEKPKIEDRKFSLGSTTLFMCIALMFLCIILSICHPNNELIKSGFEAFRIIIMTMLGYIFGSNSINKGSE